MLILTTTTKHKTVLEEKIEENLRDISLAEIYYIRHKKHK